jgi:nucleotide-binding universal stress UspA family protein
VITVIRPITHLDDQQQELLDKAVASARRADAEEEAAWKDIKTARDAGVPDTVLCEHTKRSRSTLNRRYGRRPR